MTQYQPQYRLQVTQFDDPTEWQNYGQSYVLEEEQPMVSIMKKISVERSLRSVYPHVHGLEVRIITREVSPWDTEYKPCCPNCGSPRLSSGIYERRGKKKGTQIVEEIRCDRCLEKIYTTVIKEG